MTITKLVVALAVASGGAKYYAVTTAPSLYFASASTAEAKRLPVQTKNLLPTKIQHRHQQNSQHEHHERRVIPWVSIAVLLNFLFFFRSFAAPFFDPLVRNGDVVVHA